MDDPPRDLAGLAAAVFAEDDWIATLRALETRPDWPARREAILADGEVDGLVRVHPPKERCVLETLLSQLGSAGDPRAIPRLARIGAEHAQEELRLRALHALIALGPEGIDAAAGPPDAPIDGGSGTVLAVRARAVILRGDPPHLALRGSVARKNAVLWALADALRPRSKIASAAGLLDDEAWLEAVLDAYFDPALAERAEVVLRKLDPAIWKPRVAARKRAAKKASPKARPARPTAAQKRALDAELTRMRDAIDRIVHGLEAEGFAFAGTARREPPKAAARKLAALEARVGAVPLALARFWTIVGEVDLRGSHPRWEKRTYVARGDDPHWLADPLCVIGLEAALANAEDGDFDVREAPASLRYDLTLAGDDVTKANFSGGTVWITTPSTDLDPPLHGRTGTFLEMLRESIAWRGFPGFAKIEDAPITRAR